MKRGACVATVVIAVLVAGCGLEDLTEPPPSNPAHEPATKAKGQRRVKDKRRGRLRPKASKRRPRAPRPRGAFARVTSVTDGDTIEVRLRGGIFDIRLIGIDTPETVHPSQVVECFGRAASAFTHRALEGERVRIELDVERTDRYGRTLGYVWKDGRLFNETLIARGYAQVATYPPNVKYVDRFLAAQRRAFKHDRGLWGACPARERDGRRPARGTAGGRSCDPDYRGACVPRYPPDLDCGDVAAANFRSVGSDPHAFDGDGDGLACET